MSEEKSGSSARTSLTPLVTAPEVSATEPSDKAIEVKIESTTETKTASVVDKEANISATESAPSAPPITSAENQASSAAPVKNQSNQTDPSAKEEQLREQSLLRMEALLKQSAKGIHILFENHEIAKVLTNKFDDKDFFDFQKMKRVQDVMTELVGKKTYFEKISYLRELDKSSYEMLVRTYFHIVDNTVRSEGDYRH